MLFQRSCSNDIITQAQPPSYSTQAWTIPSVLIYFKTPHQPAGQTFKIALWRSLVWSSGVIFSCLFCFFICEGLSQCRQALKAKTKQKSQRFPDKVLWKCLICCWLSGAAIRWQWSNFAALPGCMLYSVSVADPTLQPGCWGNRHSRILVPG